MFNKFIKLIAIVTLLIVGGTLVHATDYKYEYRNDMDIYAIVNKLNYGDRLIIKSYHKRIEYIIYDKQLNGIYLYTVANNTCSYGEGGSGQFIPYRDWYINGKNE